MNKEDQVPYSDCCGAETCDTEMGICPDCLEHCEFITEEETPMCDYCDTYEVEKEGQFCSKDCAGGYWGDMNEDK